MVKRHNFFLLQIIQYIFTMSMAIFGSAIVILFDATWILYR